MKLTKARFCAFIGLLSAIFMFAACKKSYENISSEVQHAPTYINMGIPYPVDPSHTERCNIYCRLQDREVFGFEFLNDLKNGRSGSTT